MLDTRFKLHFGQESAFTSVFDINPPDISDSQSLYANVLGSNKMTFTERLMLILALVPHIRPRLLDIFFTKNVAFDRPFTEFGGIRNDELGGFFPTLETLSFLLAGNDLEMHFKVLALLDRDHFFTRHQVFDFQVEGTPLSILKTPLLLTQEYISLFTKGIDYRPHFSTHFPGQLITSDMEWDDLVLAPQTRVKVGEIETWMLHGSTLMDDWRMSAKLRPGYRTLFHGPSGTGKTMTAGLIGKSTRHSVYRINFSMVVSKYIGETEKNLARVFDKAEHNQWILFFDEADAVFGKRSQIQDVHTHYANQEVAYLLQRIESFNGIVILSSSLEDNLDPAFLRRFESIIHFPLPSAAERLLIWEKGISPKARLASNVDLQMIAKRFELSGGAIMNAIRFASLEALRKNTNIITLSDLQQGIRRELLKEGGKV